MENEPQLEKEKKNRFLKAIAVTSRTVALFIGLLLWYVFEIIIKGLKKIFTEGGKAIQEPWQNFNIEKAHKPIAAVISFFVIVPVAAALMTFGVSDHLVLPATVAAGLVMPFLLLWWFTKKAEQKKYTKYK